MYLDTEDYKQENTLLNKHKPAGIYLLQVNNRNTRTRCDMFKVNNKDTRATPVASFWYLYC